MSQANQKKESEAVKASLSYGVGHVDPRTMGLRSRMETSLASASALRHDAPGKLRALSLYAAASICYLAALLLAPFNKHTQTAASLPDPVDGQPHKPSGLRSEPLSAPHNREGAENHTSPNAKPNTRGEEYESAIRRTHGTQTPPLPRGAAPPAPTINNLAIYLHHLSNALISQAHKVKHRRRTWLGSSRIVEYPGPSLDVVGLASMTSALRAVSLNPGFAIIRRAVELAESQRLSARGAERFRLELKMCTVAQGVPELMRRQEAARVAANLISYGGYE